MRDSYILLIDILINFSAGVLWRSAWQFKSMVASVNKFLFIFLAHEPIDFNYVTGPPTSSPDGSAFAPERTSPVNLHQEQTRHFSFYNIVHVSHNKRASLSGQISASLFPAPKMTDLQHKRATPIKPIDTTPVPSKRLKTDSASPSTLLGEDVPDLSDEYPKNVGDEQVATLVAQTRAIVHQQTANSTQAFLADGPENAQSYSIAAVQAIVADGLGKIHRHTMEAVQHLVAGNLYTAYQQAAADAQVLVEEAVDKEREAWDTRSKDLLAEIGSLQSKLLTTGPERDLLVARAVEAENRWAEKRAMVETLESEIRELRQETAALRDHSQDLEKQNKEFSQKVQTLRSGNGRFKDMKRQKQALQREKEVLEKEVGRLEVSHQRECNRLREESTQYEKEAKRLEDCAKFHQSESFKLRKKQTELETTVQGLQDDVKHHESECDKLRAEAKELNQRYQSYMTQIRDICTPNIKDNSPTENE